MDLLVPQALQQAPHDPETLCDYAAVLSNTEERTRHAAADKIDAAEACYDKCLAADGDRFSKPKLTIASHDDE